MKKTICIWATFYIGLYLFLTMVLAVGYVIGGSMEPTWKEHSIVICKRYPYVFDDPVPDYGDTIVFNCREKNSRLIKRVVGLPGDEISFQDGYLIRNGELIVEDYLPVQGETFCHKTFLVPANCVFVLGDNRRASYDSRRLDSPYIPLSDIIAEAVLQIPTPFRFG